MSIRMPNNEFAPTQPGLIQDPIILSNMSNARKGYALNKNVLLAIGLFFLLFFTGLAIYAGHAPAGAAFHEENYDFFRQLAMEHEDEQVQVSRLDAYYRDNWYYYDVSYTVGANELRRVYCGPRVNSPVWGCFDPAVLETSLYVEDQQLYNSWQLAMEFGKHKVFDNKQIQDYLDDVYNR